MFCDLSLIGCGSFWFQLSTVSFFWFDSITGKKWRSHVVTTVETQCQVSVSSLPCLCGCVESIVSLYALYRVPAVRAAVAALQVCCRGHCRCAVVGTRPCPAVGTHGECSTVFHLHVYPSRFLLHVCPSRFLRIPQQRKPSLRWPHIRTTTETKRPN